MSSEPVIRVSNLSRSFKKTRALRGIDLEIMAGELFGIVGPDGSGKTTLIQSLCAILDPTEGSISVNGFDTVADAKTITSTIGYMSQAYSLYEDLTVEENLEFFAEIRGVSDAEFARRRERLLTFSGLSPFLARKTKALSGGMQKKLALCCSLLHEPELLILDEPTLGVDPLSRRELWRMLAEYRAQKKTIVIATSYMDEAERCDRVAMLAEGRVLACQEPNRFGADLETAFRARLKPVGVPSSVPFNDLPAKGDPIVVRNLSRSFGEFRAVDGVSFDIAQGEIFGLLGPNGSGKSTTIRILCGILPPSSGSARIADADVTSSPETVRGRIGYMSQKFSLYLDLTAAENIEFFGGVYGLDADTLTERKAWVLAMAGLAGRERVLARDLSGALRQRLALGCAVLHQPEVLFLDEPTSGVDPSSRASFWTLIRLIADSGTTVLVTTHYLREAEDCDRIAFIHRGRLLEIGTPRSVRQRYGGGSLEESFVRAMEQAA